MLVSERQYDEGATLFRRETLAHKSAYRDNEAPRVTGFDVEANDVE